MERTDYLSAKYQWKTRGENCPICNSLAGRVYTYDTWISASVLPGFHLHCNCYLEQVSAGTPESSLDIFGTDLRSLLDNKYFLGINWFNNDWIPYNQYFATRLTNLVQQTGMTLGEAMKSLNDSDREGLFFKAKAPLLDQFFQWRVFRTLNIFEGADEVVSRSLTPDVSVPTVRYPMYTHHTLSRLNLGE
jgi:hypothetical protein